MSYFFIQCGSSKENQKKDERKTKESQKKVERFRDSKFNISDDNKLANFKKVERKMKESRKKVKRKMTEIGRVYSPSTPDFCYCRRQLKPRMSFRQETNLYPIQSDRYCDQWAYSLSTPGQKILPKAVIIQNEFVSSTALNRLRQFFVKSPLALDRDWFQITAEGSQDLE